MASMAPIAASHPGACRPSYSTKANYPAWHDMAWRQAPSQLTSAAKRAVARSTSFERFQPSCRRGSHRRGRSESLHVVKTRSLALFAPERGGNYEVWKQRLLSADLVAYAACDVAYLLEVKSE